MKNGFIETDRSKRRADIFLNHPTAKEFKENKKTLLLNIPTTKDMKPLMNQGEPIVCLKTIRQLIQCEGKIKVLSDFPIVNQNKSK